MAPFMTRQNTRRCKSDFQLRRATVRYILSAAPEIDNGNPGQYESQFKDSVFFEVVAWDKHGAGAPMLASKTPQTAIDKDCRPLPSAISWWASR